MVTVNFMTRKQRMSKPTLTEVYNALGVLERAGMLEKMQRKQTRITPDNHLTAMETVDTLNKPIRKSRKKWRKMTDKDIETAVAMYNVDNATAAEIASTLGFSASCIARNIGIV